MFSIKQTISGMVLAVLSMSVPCAADTDDLTLRYASARKIENLDPAMVADTESAILMSNIYDCLMRTSDDNNFVEPDLAESWDVSEDLKTYTFKLRKGLFFHDGTVIDAEAVKFNFERQLKHNRTSEMKNSADVFDKVRSIEAADPLTVVIRLESPSSSFIYNMARNGVASIASPTAIKKHHNNISRHPVGSGPYRVLSMDDQGKLLLGAFERYRKPLPDYSKIRITPMLSQWDRAFALNNNEIDLIAHVSESNMAEIEESGNVIHKTPGRNVSYMVFNHRKGAKTSDIDVRRAVCSSINIHELNHFLYQQSSVPAYSFSENILSPDIHSLRHISYSPSAAKKIFREKGVRSLKIIVYNATRIYNSMGGALLADAVSNYLREAGIDSEIKVMDDSLFVKSLKTESWDIAFTGWVGDTVDPLNMLLPLYSTSPDLNRGMWINEAFRNEIDKCLATFDAAQRRLHLLHAEQIIIDDVAVLPLSHAKNVLASHPEITGDFIDPLGNIHFDRIRRISQNTDRRM